MYKYGDQKDSPLYFKSQEVRPEGFSYYNRVYHSDGSDLGRDTQHGGPDIGGSGVGDVPHYHGHGGHGSGEPAHYGGSDIEDGSHHGGSGIGGVTHRGGHDIGGSDTAGHYEGYTHGGDHHYGDPGAGGHHRSDGHDGGAGGSYDYPAQEDSHASPSVYPSNHIDSRSRDEFMAEPDVHQYYHFDTHHRESPPAAEVSAQYSSSPPGPDPSYVPHYGHQQRQHSDRGTDVVENILNRFDDVEAEYADVLLYDEFDDYAMELEFEADM